MHNPDVILGYWYLFEALANLSRFVGWTLLSSSGRRRCAPKTLCSNIASAQQLLRECWVFSSSSSHAEHIGSDRTFIIVRCLLRTVWPVIRPTKTRRSCLFKPRAKLVSCLSGPSMNSLAWQHPLFACQHLHIFVTSSISPTSENKTLSWNRYTVQNSPNIHLIYLFSWHDSFTSRQDSKELSTTYFW